MLTKEMSIAKLKLLTILGFLALMLSFLIPTLAHSQQSSSITVTREAFLTFNSSFENFTFDFSNIAADVSGADLFSDSGTTLSDLRLLKIKDNRGCGGFNLQMEATTFTPSGPNTVTTDNFHVITSTAMENPPSGSANNNIYYLSGFNGAQNATAPVNSSCPKFDQTTTFTDPSCITSNNTLNGLVDIIQGGLEAPAGRSGEMALGLAFHLQIPPYTLPDTYYSTITYTLTDATTGTCS